MDGGGPLGKTAWSVDESGWDLDLDLDLDFLYETVGNGYGLNTAILLAFIRKRRECGIEVQ